MLLNKHSLLEQINAKSVSKFSGEDKQLREKRICDLGDECAKRICDLGDGCEIHEKTFHLQ